MAYWDWARVEKGCVLPAHAHPGAPPLPPARVTRARARPDPKKRDCAEATRPTESNRANCTVARRGMVQGWTRQSRIPTLPHNAPPCSDVGARRTFPPSSSLCSSHWPEPRARQGARWCSQAASRILPKIPEDSCCTPSARVSRSRCWAGSVVVIGVNLPVVL